MTQYDYYHNLDNHPFTGVHDVCFEARLSEEENLDSFFDPELEKLIFSKEKRKEIEQAIKELDKKYPGWRNLLQNT